MLLLDSKAHCAGLQRGQHRSRMHRQREGQPADEAAPVISYKAAVMLSMSTIFDKNHCAGLLTLQRQQERLQRDQHISRMQRRREGRPPDEPALEPGPSAQGRFMVRVSRLGSGITRRDVRRFFKDFDIDDDSIRCAIRFGPYLLRSQGLHMTTCSAMLGWGKKGTGSASEWRQACDAEIQRLAGK